MPLANSSGRRFCWRPILAAVTRRLPGPSGYIRFYAQACRGLSHIVRGKPTSATQNLSEALTFARSRKAGLESEPRILADLANAYRLSGDHAKAICAVDEAISVASGRHAPVAECLARIVRADLLGRVPAAAEPSGSPEASAVTVEFLGARVEVRGTPGLAVLSDLFLALRRTRSC